MRGRRGGMEEKEGDRGEKRKLTTRQRIYLQGVQRNKDVLVLYISEQEFGFSKLNQNSYT